LFYNVVFNHDFFVIFGVVDGVEFVLDGVEPGLTFLGEVRFGESAGEGEGDTPLACSAS
jgi:hypothetical protein